MPPRFNPDVPFELAPLPPASIDRRDPDLLEALIAAHRELATLKGLLDRTSNPWLLISPAILQESVASSGIENIHTTVADVLQGELFPEPERRAADKEVIRYRDAMAWAEANRKRVAVSTRLIQGIHSRLLPHDPPAFRKVQNRLQNSDTQQTIFTPPPSSAIQGLLGNWESFANARDDGWDPLIRCAITHYQFEAIHPFTDGNGRAGRILLVILLLEQEILSAPVLYVSSYLLQNRQEYYDRLLRVSTQGDWKGYLLFMLKAFRNQGEVTRKAVVRILEHHEQLRKQIGDRAPKLSKIELVNHLCARPITSPSALSRDLGVSMVTATKYLEALKDAGVLRDRWVGKYHFFMNSKLLQLLQSSS